MWEEKFVETDIGKLRVCFTTTTHAHVSTGSGETVTCRNKKYTVSVHLYLIDGLWRTKSEREGGYTSIRKTASTAYGQSFAAPTIAATIIDHCQLALLKVLEAEPGLPAKSEVEALKMRLGTLEAERNKLLAAASDAALEIAACHDRRKVIDPECLYGELGGSAL
jgi:hypothetical protein